MNTAEWIIVCILSATLFIFLICGIIFLVKLMGLIKEAKKITITAQSIAEKADDVAGNVRKITYMGSLNSIANLIKKRYNSNKKTKE